MTWYPDAKRNRAVEQGESAKIRWELVPYTRGSGLELGCGPWKAFRHFIGIDAKEYREAGPDGPSLVMDCSHLGSFADRGYDFVYSSHLLEHLKDTRAVLKEWMRVIDVGGHLVLYLPHRDFYPNIGEPGGNEDHKHDFVPEDIIDAMLEVAPDWELVENQVRSAGDEYSFFQVYRKLAPGVGHVDQKPAPKAKTAAVFRPGAYGDVIFASSVIWHLKREGYHVTLFTEDQGEEVVRHDPNVDAIVTIGKEQIPTGFLTQYFEAISGNYDRAVNLVESVEKNGIAWPTDGRFLWPDKMRRKVFGGNYLELLHDLADVPHEFYQRFYSTKEELEVAAAWRREFCGDVPVVMIAASGSTAPKFWPHLPRLVEELAKAGAHVIVAGDLRGMKLAEGDRVTVIGTTWPMRKVLALAQVMDLVIGQETGIMNAVAMEAMPKIVLLSHSTVENLTKHWANTVSVAGDVPCYPCHRIHLDFNKCPRDEATGCSACQAAITPERVLHLALDLVSIDVTQVLHELERT